MHMPGYPPGVPSQYSVHVHPWPTRFHGPLYQRPVFRMPWKRQPQNVLMPWQFAGLGDATGVSFMTVAVGAAVVLAASYLAYQGGLSEGLDRGYEEGYESARSR